MPEGVWACQSTRLVPILRSFGTSHDGDNLTVVWGKVTALLGSGGEFRYDWRLKMVYCLLSHPHTLRPNDRNRSIESRQLRRQILSGSESENQRRKYLWNPLRETDPIGCPSTRYADRIVHSRSRIQTSWTSKDSALPLLHLQVSTSQSLLLPAEVPPLMRAVLPSHTRLNAPAPIDCRRPVGTDSRSSWVSWCNVKLSRNMRK